MRRLSFAFASITSLALLPIFTPARSEAQVSAGLVLDGLRSLQVAIGQVYGVPLDRVSRFPRMRSMDELPVVYFLAREARVSPETVMALRSRGWSWFDVTNHLGLSPSIFAPIRSRQGPPYGRAVGYWRKREAESLRRFSDREIVDFVNAQFWEDYDRRQPAYREPAYRQPVYGQPVAQAGRGNGRGNGRGGGGF